MFSGWEIYSLVDASVFAVIAVICIVSLGLYYAPKVSQIVAQFVNSFFWQIVANPKGYTIYNDE